MLYFREVVVETLFLGTSGRSAFDGQSRRFKLGAQPLARGVHHRRIFQRLAGLYLNGGITEHFGGPGVFGLITVVTGQREVTDAVTASTTFGHNVLHCERPARLPTIRTRSLPFLQHILADFIA